MWKEKISSYKNPLVDSRFKLRGRISFFMAENNSNKSMVIGGFVIAFLSIILLGITIINQFNFLY